MFALPFAKRTSPAELKGNGLVLRAPRPADFETWRELRASSAEFLMPWEPAWPSDDLTWTGYRRRLVRYQSDAARKTSCTWFILEDEGKVLAGGLTLSGIRFGASRSAQIGYWMGARHAGKGIMRRALLVVLQEAFTGMGLERIEAACLEENVRSNRLLSGLGFQREGHLRSYLEIAGKRRDHILYALLRPGYRALTAANNKAMNGASPDEVQARAS